MGRKGREEEQKGTKKKGWWVVIGKGTDRERGTEREREKCVAREWWDEVKWQASNESRND